TGFALAEGLGLEPGVRVDAANPHEYKLPNIADLPPLETLILEPDLSLGLTPIGEGPNVGMSAAIACAVIDAVGKQVDIPIAPEKLLPLPLGEGGGEGAAPGAALTRLAPSAPRRPLPEGAAK